MPIDRYTVVGMLSSFWEGNQSANNCDDYKIYSLFNTGAKLAPWVTLAFDPPAGKALIDAINLVCPELLTNSNAFYDPIKVVINPQATCVTRYTEPGHILFPGKTTTCLYQDECGDVYLRTIGEGFHFCGNTAGGAMMSALNTYVGTIIFNNNHQRFKSASGF